jgi:hypothetical protein
MLALSAPARLISDAASAGIVSQRIEAGELAPRDQP